MVQGMPSTLPFAQHVLNPLTLLIPWTTLKPDDAPKEQEVRLHGIRQMEIQAWAARLTSTDPSKPAAWKHAMSLSFSGAPQEEEAAALPLTVALGKTSWREFQKTFFRLRAQKLSSGYGLKTKSKNGQVETAGFAPSSARLRASVAWMHDGACNAREHG